MAEGKIGVLDAYERYGAIENEKVVLPQADVMCSCDCKCDGCGKIYYEPNIKMKFGEFNVCDDCKNNPKIQFQ